jgi:hypothetical protein
LPTGRDVLVIWKGAQAPVAEVTLICQLPEAGAAAEPFTDLVGALRPETFENTIALLHLQTQRRVHGGTCIRSANADKHGGLTGTTRVLLWVGLIGPVHLQLHRFGATHTKVIIKVTSTLCTGQLQCARPLTRKFTKLRLRQFTKSKRVPLSGESIQ